MRRYFVALLLLVLLLPVAAYAQDGRPTKPPPGQPTQLAPVPTESVEGSAQQLYADVEPQLGMQVLSTVDAPYFFDGYPLAGGDKYVDVGGDCVPGYAAPIAALGIVWPSDSGPVTLTFYPDEETKATAFLIWEMMENQWWCNTEFLETPSYDFDNMGMGVYYVWLMTPREQVVSGWLDVLETGAE